MSQEVGSAHHDQHYSHLSRHVGGTLTDDSPGLSLISFSSPDNLSRSKSPVFQGRMLKLSKGK